MALARITVVSFILAAVIVTLVVGFLRFLRVYPGLRTRSERAVLESPQPPVAHALFVLGSGGHTAEMLDMLSYLPIHRYVYRTYVVQEGDSFSAIKAEQFEKILQTVHGPEQNARIGDSHYRILHVPRARQIHQPLFTTPFSALYSLFRCLSILSRVGPKLSVEDDVPRLRNKSGNRFIKVTTPDIIVTNGPATGVMVVLAAFILNYFGLQGHGQMRTIYVESWARVSTLSLSGNILKYLGLTDRFFIQWPKLATGRAEYRGPLVH